MLLRKLTLNGFKTFASKADFEFKQGITAVVGPNGSGKSNLSDAIRWALGEQSAKLLRGSSMSDVIFAGTTARKPASMAEVTVVIDNKDRALGIDFDEVSITRRVYKDGESQFLINNIECRLKDVSELFAGTGLGKEAYAAIEQGKVDAIISSQPQDRRGIFDEASGIMRYKFRKREAERKLADVEDRTGRASEILSEISNKKPVLEKQASEAQQYKSASLELKQLEFSIICRETADAARQLSAYEASLAKKETEVKKLESDLSLAEAGYEEWKLKSAELSMKLENASLTAQASAASAQKHEMAAMESNSKARRIRDDKERSQKEAERLRDEASKASKAADELSRRQDEVKALLDNAAANASAKQRKLDELRVLLEKIEGEADEARSVYFDKVSKASTIRNGISSCKEKLAGFDTVEQRLRSVYDEGSAKCESLKRQEREIRSSIEENEAALLKAKAEEVEAKTRLSALLSDRDRIAEEYSRISATIARSEAVLEGLQGMQEEHEGYPSAVRFLLDAGKKGKLSGIIGPVGDLIDIPKGSEAAIESALGNQFADIICESSKDAEAAIALLKANSQGKCTFLPLDMVRGGQIKPEARLKEASGYIGVASETVSFEERLRPAIEYLLGSTVLFMDLKSAIDAQKSGVRTRSVTKDGELLTAGGAITGGSRRADRSSVFERKNRAAEMSSQLQSSANSASVLKMSLEDTIERISESSLKAELTSKRIAELSAARKSLESDLERNVFMMATIDRQIGSAENELSEIGNQRDKHKNEMKRLEAELVAADRSISEHVGSDSDVKEKKDGLSAEIGEVTRQMTEALMERASKESEFKGIVQARAEVESRIAAYLYEADRIEKTFEGVHEDYKINISASEEESALAQQFAQQAQRASAEADHLRAGKQEAESEASNFEQSMKSLRRRLANSIEAESSIALQKARISGELSVLSSRLASEHGATLEQAMASVPDEFDKEASANRVGELKEMIMGMGDVNLTAAEELASVNDRITFMSNQIEDLEKARASLSQVIREAERTARKQFDEMFEQIRLNFKEIFSRMFAGGTADIILTDDEEPLESGIEIICKPPGKKLSQLSLLSGGEKALSAIALIFAFLKARPAPFFLLDEIDAALDDANVDRFRELVSEYSQSSQMILITHRRRTMEAADRVYGVTMEENGVSKAVCVDTSELLFKEGLVQ